jgi:hypothetical protein
MDVRKISAKAEPMGPAKIVRVPRLSVNKKLFKPKGKLSTRDYLKKELQPVEQFGSSGFGKTGMDGEN